MKVVGTKFQLRVWNETKKIHRGRTESYKCITNKHQACRTEVNEFTKNELNFLSNAMFMISAIRELFNTVISITQLDLALVIVIVKELASIVIIRLLLNEKQFVVKSNNLKLISSKVMPIA